MQETAAFESRPNNPLGARDSWPVTGPIYGIAERHGKPAPSRTLWQRFTTASPEQTDIAAASGTSPIWY